MNSQSHSIENEANHSRSPQILNRMSRRSRLSVFSASLLFLVVLSFTPHEAYAQSYFGGYVGYNFDVYRFPDGFSESSNGAMAVGAQAHLRQGSLPIILNPSLDYYRNGRFKYPGLQLSMNGLYPIEVENAPITPFAGLGLAATVLIVADEVGDVVSSNGLSLGLNLTAGAMFDAGVVRPFAQGRYTLGNHRVFIEEGEEGSGFQVMVGVLVPIGM